MAIVVGVAAAALGAPLARADVGSSVAGPGATAATVTTVDTAILGAVPAVAPAAAAGQAVDAAPSSVTATPPSVPTAVAPVEEPPPSQDAQAAEAPAPVPAPQAEESALQRAAETRGTDAPVPAPTEASDITPRAPVSPSVGAVAGVEQQSPVNVNLSIRIESPGDGGPVTQLNSVVAAVAAGAGAVVEPSNVGAVTGAATVSEGLRPQSSDIGRDTTTFTPEPRTDPVADPPCDPDGGCCGSGERTPACVNGNPAEDVVGIFSVLFGSPSVGRANIGSNIVGAGQFGPVNVNVSIRIRSPGNDGPVVQSNLIQVHAAVSVSVPQAVFPPVTVDPSADLVPPSDEQAPAAGEGDPLQATVEAGTATAPVTATAPGTMSAATVVPGLPTVGIPLHVPAISPAAVLISPLAGRPDQATTASALVASAVQAAVGGPRRTTGDAHGAGHRKRAGRPPAPAPSPALPPLEAALAAAPPAAGGGGGLLPVALCLPFLIPLLDAGLGRLRATRRTASGHDGRRPERPG